MSTADLLARLDARGVTLRADGDRLRFQAPPGALDDALRAEMAARKADLLAALRAAPTAPPPLDRLASDAEPPLSFGQQRLWFLERLHPGSCAYHIPAAFDLDGPLDVEMLRRAFEAVVARHEPLRTTFHDEGGTPRLAVVPPEPFELPVEDVPEGPQQERAALRRSLAEARRPFDLARGPMLRARLLRLGPERHTLLVTTHHIASDGWSLGVLAREVSAAYRGEALPPLPIRYADFAAWQRRAFSGETAERALRYWTAALADPPPVLDLPTDAPRPPVQTFHGALCARRLPASVVRAADRLARDEGVSLFMVLHAAWAALLHRLTGADDLTVATPVAGRALAETEPLVGFFVNTLVLRTRQDERTPFRALVRQVREVALGAFEHQAAPFEQVTERLGVPRSLRHPPLAQVLFAHQNMPAEQLRLKGLAPASVRFFGGTAKYDLSLFTEEQAGGLLCTAEYNVDLFEGETVERLLGHFAVLLDAALRDPDEALGRLPLLTEAEARLLVLGWNETERRVPETTISEMIEAQTARTPDAPAVTTGSDTWTYARLDAEAERVARVLRARGIGRERFVAVCMERSNELMAALLGVMKAGAAYLPLDPDHPRARLAFMLDEAEVPLVLTQRHLADRLPGTVPTLCLDEPFDAPDLVPQGRPSPRGACYLLYTSGSTGQPKGVVVEHRSVANKLFWQQEQFRLAEGEAVLQKTPVTFDVSVNELFWPLAVGGRIVMTPPGAHRDPRIVLRLLADERIAVCHFVPSQLGPFLDSVSASELAACGALRIVMCSGEALAPDHVARFYRAASGAGLDGVRMHNLYGPTEATVEVTHWACPPSPTPPATVPIGYPITNVRALVLDAAGRPCPVGLWGELFLGGVQVARGYLRRPELTAERFVPDPYRAGGRLYRTGDRARLRPDGAIEYGGRLDGQVKLRGVRIETGEIEATLRGLDGVADAVAVLREDGPDGAARLVAYVVGSDANADELRRRLAATLPEVMVPSAFVALDALPLTPSGKVDRRALPEPPRPASSARFAPPTTVTEHLVADAWAATLRRDAVGLDDNFFDLGGHSLLAVELVTRLGRALGREVPLLDVFAHPTVRALSAHLAPRDEDPLSDPAADRLRATVARAVRRRNPSPPIP